jgi:23S rRNA pseudouridine955/2504/2580 synthase
MVSLPTKTSKVHQKVVSEEMAGQRLDNFLITYLKGVPKTRVYRIIRKGEVRVNKGRIKPDYRLVAGDIIRIPPIRLGEVPSAGSRQVGSKISQLLSWVLYEDDKLLIINKPAGMAVHGGSGVSWGIIEALRQIREQDDLELVHRLDRDTSGCLMIAKRRSTLKAIHELLKNGQVEKTYWALVKGPWLGGASCDAPLKKNQLSSGERFVKVSEDGQESLTHFRILEEYQQTTLMEAKPVTGRTHQIRVHAAFAGSPIIGDTKYGDADFNRLMKTKGLSRLFLHARKISLTLPGYPNTLSVEAPLDEPFRLGLERLAEE